ncbi:MAG TPA: DUF6049 family protein [Acidimicrobiales bacterium]|nr:DUF6049 family protein [Acidimicrobiales bacterium]
MTARRARALLVLAVVCGSTLLATPGPGSTAGAAPGAPSADEAASIRLRALDPWVQAVDTVSATVSVADIPSGAKLTPVLHRAVATRSAFGLTANGENLSGVEAQLTEHDLKRGSASVTVRFSVDDGSAPPPDEAASPPADVDSVTLTQPGVYPLVFTVTDADGSTIASLVAYIVRLPTSPAEGTSGRESLRVASEFRLQPRPRLDRSGNPIPTEAARAATDALIEGLDASTDAVRRSFGFAVSPALLDALATDESDDDAARVLRLAALVDGLPLQSQPWSPVNLAGWIATPELAPLADRSTDSGDETLGDRLHLPSPAIADLAAWDGRPSEQSLRWFANRGTTAFLIPDDRLDDLDTSAFPRTLAAPFLVDLGEGRTAPAVQLDRGLAAHFTNDDPVLGANQLIADLSVIALDLPAITRGMVVAPPAGRTPSAAFLAAYVAALQGAHPAGSDPLVAPTSLTGLIESTPAARTAGDTASEGPTLQRSLRQGASPAPSSELGAQMTVTGGLVDSLATMVPGGSAHSQTVTRQLRNRMSVAAMPGVGAAARDREFAAIRSQVTTSAKSVRLPPRQTITLTSDTASLPVTIRRPSDGPTQVVVHIDAPTRLELPDGKSQAVRLDDTTTRFDIRVHSDSPGDTIVRLTVTSPDNTLVVGTSEIVVRSTAASGVGFIISFGSLAFLILWWGRDIIRTRRRRRARHVPPAELIDID